MSSINKHKIKALMFFDNETFDYSLKPIRREIIKTLKIRIDKHIKEIVKEYSLNISYISTVIESKNSITEYYLQYKGNKIYQIYITFSESYVSLYFKSMNYDYINKTFVLNIKGYKI